jgi:hypothetical protein
MKRLFPKKQKRADSTPKTRPRGSGNPKRVLICSDLHCGHEAGLTPDWHDAKPHTENIPTIDLSVNDLPTKNPATISELMKIRALDPGAASLIRTRQLYERRRACWNWFTKEVTALGPLDLAIWNGDLIDGKGSKSGQTELLTADRARQAEMAASILDHVGASANLIAYGTPYHGGKFEDWEDEVAAQAKNVAKIGSSDWVNVNGLTIGYKHHCSRSTIPHGPFTLIAKQKLWETLWAERDEYPSSDILIRSHVHYHRYCGGPGWVAMTTPALQAYDGSKVARFALGVCDYGFIWIDVWGKGDYQWHVVSLKLLSARDAVVTL